MRRQRSHAAAFALLVCLIAMPAFAKDMPLWEGLKKTPGMLAADKEFIATVDTETKGDLKAGARHIVKRGWEAFNANDANLAIRRFNQASLLDQSNGEIYWGFALATHVRGDGLSVSERWFGEAEKHVRKSAALFSDHGRVLDEKGQPKRARSYFEKALAIDPNFLQAHIGMARVYAQLGDRMNAEFHLKKIEQLKK
jgi:Tfp pilus assembly protein PilF